MLNNKFENVNITGNTSLAYEGARLLEEFFSVPIISGGAFCRKAQVFMLKLCAVTQVEWTAEVKYFDKEKVFAVLLSALCEDPCFILVTLCSNKNKSSVTTTRKLLETMFTSDKRVAYPVQFISLLFTGHYGKYTTTKVNLGSGCGVMTVKPEKLNFLTKFCYKCKYTDKDIAAANCTILDTVELVDSTVEFSNWIKRYNFNDLG